MFCSMHSLLPYQSLNNCFDSFLYSPRSITLSIVEKHLEHHHVKTDVLSSKCGSSADTTLATSLSNAGERFPNVSQVFLDAPNVMHPRTPNSSRYMKTARSARFGYCRNLAMRICQVSRIFPWDIQDNGSNMFES